MRPSLRSTSSWTNAPVNGSLSHGAVVSQAAKRTTASLTRTAWPGLKVMSRTIPLRLLISPSTATRSAIGVTPATAPGPRATVPAAEGPACCAGLFRSQPPAPKAAAHATTAHKAQAARTLSRASTADSPRSLPGAPCRCQARRRGETRPSFRSDSWPRADGICGAAAAPCRAGRRSSP